MPYNRTRIGDLLKREREEAEKGVGKGTARGQDWSLGTRVEEEREKEMGCG